MSWLTPLSGGSWLTEPAISLSYRYRNPEKRRAQMREVMRRRRRRLKGLSNNALSEGESGKRGFPVVLLETASSGES